MEEEENRIFNVNCIGAVLELYIPAFADLLDIVKERE
jgi:hypothetical protein